MAPSQASGSHVATIGIITFNCGRELVDPDLFAHNLVQTTNWQQGPDIIFLSLQEVGPIAHSFLGGSFLRPYLARFSLAIRKAAQIWDGQEQHVPNPSGLSNSIASTKASPSGSQGTLPESKDATASTSSYTTLDAQNLGMTAFMLFVRSSCMSRIRYVERGGTGLGFLEMGNKGCLGIRIGYEHAATIAPLTFLAAHLAPGEQRLEQRNADWRRIVEDIVFEPRGSTVARSQTSVPTSSTEGADERETEPLLGRNSDDSSKQEEDRRIYGSGSLVFLAGDLNYRTSSIPPTPADSQQFPQPASLTDIHTFQQLLSCDQLTQEHRAQRALHGFHEAAVTFPPTYKYAKATRLAAAKSQAEVYGRQPSVWSAWRWPSWCDRIWVLGELAGQIFGREGFQYLALPLLPSSDHQPVAMYCEVPLEGLAETLEARRKAERAPFDMKMDWRARRARARRLEMVVGFVVYFAWTWEGNALVLATVIGALGGLALVHAALESGRAG